MPTTILILLIVLILFIVAFMLFRTLTYARPLAAVEPVELEEIDPTGVAEHLAGALRFQTVSVMDNNPAGYMPFLDLQRYLEQVYPQVHLHLARKRIHDYALLYTWVGSDPDLNPIVLMAHQDVVPVDPETLNQWEHPPFDGVIADGYVWGRGALDCKMQMIGALEAVERLVSAGYKPERTVYLAFGFDEEIGGAQGAKEIVNFLKDQGITPEAVLDEGLAVVEGILPGVDTPVGLIGTCEKGMLTLKLTVDTEAGHASTPPRETAIGILSKALAFLEATPQRTDLSSANQLFRGLGPVLPFQFQLALANQWLFGGILRQRLEKSPSTNALIHTTCAPTIINAGTKENVLPSRATAYVNIRMIPGDTIAAVCDRVRKIIDDDRVKFEPVEGAAAQPSSISRTDTPAYEGLATTIREVFDGVPVAPMLMLGASDARYYHDFCEGVYRFIPLVFTDDVRTRVHGLNERVSVEGMGQMVQFFIRLIENWAGEEEQASS